MMLRILLLLLVLSTPVLASPTVEQVTDALNQFGVSKQAPEQTTIKSLKSKGKFGENVYEIRTKSIDGSRFSYHFYIAKQTNLDSDEIANLRDIDPLVEKYNADAITRGRGAVFARYLGEFESGNEVYILFNEAHGDSVYNLMVNGAIAAGFSSTYFRDQEIWLRHFEKVGRDIAVFHLAFGELDSETSKWKTLVHGDLHLSNVFYSSYSHRTTFIDYETMSKYINSKTSITTDTYRLFNFSRPELEKAVKGKVEDSYMKHDLRGATFITEQQKQSMAKKVEAAFKVLDQYFMALETGYEAAFADAGYSIGVRTGLVK